MTRVILLFCLAALFAGCGVDTVGVSPPSDRLHYPVSIAAHPDGRYVYIANAGFDRTFSEGTITVFDTESGQFLSNATTRVGLFVGEIALSVRGDVVLGTTTSRDDDHLIQFEVRAERGDSEGHLTVIGTTSDFGGREFARDPYAVDLDEDGAFIGHLARGVVSRWGYSAAGTGDMLEFRCSLTLPGGTSHLARHPALGWWYVTDRAGPGIYAVREKPLPAVLRTENRACELEIAATIVAPSLTSRGLAFNDDGSLLFVASSGDDSLRVYDTSVGYLGRPRNRLIKSIPIGLNPATVRVAPGEAGEGLVYITLYGDERVIVVDPRTLMTIARVKVGRTPHDLAFGHDADGALVAYVTNFEDASLSIIDIDPASSSRFSLREIKK